MELTKTLSVRQERNGRIIHKVDQAILDLFWTLAEGDDSQRLQAAEKLLKRLTDNSSKKPDEARAEMDYCLQRLVRGLASNRKFARVGYAVALTKLLRAAGNIRVDDMLNLITEQLKVSQHDPKSEVGSKLLGQVFAYAALMQSEQVSEGQHVETIMTELRSLGSKRSYIRPICTQCLLDVVKCTSPDVFAGSVWPRLRRELGKGWEACTADRLLLLIACKHKDKTLVNKEFLKDHWGAARVLHKKNYDQLLHVLMRSVELPQLLPLLLETVVAEVTSKDCDIVEFWIKVGNPLLTSTEPRKHTAMTLFNLLFKHTSDPKQVQGMLFPSVASLLYHTADHKESQLLDVCVRAESLLVEWCKKQEEGGGTLDLVKGFLRKWHRSGHAAFLHSATFASIVSSLKGEEMKVFAELCMDSILGRSSVLRGEEGEELDPERSKKLGQQLVPLLRQVTLSPTVQRGEFPPHILQFLFLHTFFRVVKATKDIPHCQETSPGLTSAVRGVCQTTFYRILGQLLSTRPERMSQQEHMQNYIRVLTDLALYAQLLLSSSEFVRPVKEIGDEVLAEWQQVMDVVSVKKSQKDKSASDSLGEMETFKLLILHLAFDLFTEPGPTSELLQDVFVCRDKAAKKKRSKPNAGGEPDWVEVVTEVLLSMLSRASKLARKTTVAVFRCLSAHLTPAALSLITQVLMSDKSKKDPDEDLFEFEDMEVEKVNGAAEDEEEEEDDKSEEEEMASEEESGGDDEDDDEGDEPVDEGLRRSVKAALGTAAADSDNEEEEEDLSDSEMFKLDEQLAAAFRSMKRPTKKDKKEKQREVGNFRLRALDLVEAIVGGDRCGDLGLELLEPLLRLVVSKVKGQQGEGHENREKQLCGRATEIFHALCKHRNLSDSIHSEGDMVATLNALLSFAQSVSSPQLVAEVANGCLFIMRLLTNQLPPAPSPPKTRAMRESGDAKASQQNSGDGQKTFVQAIQSALEEDFIVRRNSKYNLVFFKHMIDKYPLVFWPLMSTLVKSLKSSDTRVHTKTQACTLLGLLLRMNKRPTLSDEQWSDFMQTALPVLKKLVLDQQKESLKSGLMLELLTVLNNAAQMASAQELQVVAPAELMSHLTEVKGAFNKDTRKMHNKLTQTLIQAKQGQKKGQKRKHQDSESGGM